MNLGEAYPHQALEIKGRGLETDTRIGPGILCAGCRSGMVFRRKEQNHSTVWCSWIGRSVPLDIVECSGFLSKKSLTLNEMGEIALPVDGRVGIHDKSYR